MDQCSSGLAPRSLDVYLLMNSLVIFSPYLVTTPQSEFSNLHRENFLLSIGNEDWATLMVRSFSYLWDKEGETS